MHPPSEGGDNAQVSQLQPVQHNVTPQITPVEEPLHSEDPENDYERALERARQLEAQQAQQPQQPEIGMAAAMEAGALPEPVQAVPTPVAEPTPETILSEPYTGFDRGQNVIVNFGGQQYQGFVQSKRGFKTGTARIVLTGDPEDKSFRCIPYNNIRKA